MAYTAAGEPQLRLPRASTQTAWREIPQTLSAEFVAGLWAYVPPTGLGEKRKPVNVPVHGSGRNYSGRGPSDGSSQLGTSAHHVGLPRHHEK